ncbi:MAG: enoyl-CoA hydratase/isomerase family protein [Solirubrobacterales bacterium]
MADPASGYIRLAREGPVGTLLIDRAERSNAWLFQMWGEATDAIAQADSDPDVRVILIRSSSESVFSGGADLDQLAEMTSADDAGARVDAHLAAVEAFLSSLENSPKLVVAVIDGAAVGAGLEVACACDLRVASDRARFGIPAARHGIVIARPDVARLARVVGWAFASELLLTARTIESEEAMRRGLVSNLVSTGALDSAVDQLVKRAAGLSPGSIAEMKRHLQDIWPSHTGDDQGFATSRDALLSPELRSALAGRPRTESIRRDP